MSSSSQQVVPFMEPLHVLGGGSIGLLFAASIRAAFPSYPICLLLREHHRPRIDPDEHNIMVCVMNRGRPRVVPVPAQIIGDKNSMRSRPIRNLVVATKAYAAVEAVRSVQDRLQNSDAAGTIIVLCNGALAVEDELALTIPLPASTNMILATTTHGAYQADADDDMYRVIHAGQGLTLVENHASLSQLLDQSGLNSSSVSENQMTLMMWQKLAANCAINPLTALYQCENGRLLQQLSSSLPTVDEIIQEVSRVANGMLSASHSSEVMVQLDFESLRAFVYKVMDDTQHNRSSMLQDVTKRQRTEIDYLNGYVVEKGKVLGIDSPANAELCRRIQALSDH
jgi:2-dehydropantoate 2-reductase